MIVKNTFSLSFFKFQIKGILKKKENESPKKYYKPKIKRIDLNADQAILQACKVGGNYFSGTNICQLNGGLPTGCAIYWRGQTAHTWGMGGGVSTDTQPS